MAEKKRVFSGIQPSGRLHLGNYVGAIRNWIPMQDEYFCIYGIVDYHAMTVHFNPKEMEDRIFNAAVDYLAAGLDPGKSILMVQSTVSEHTELAWILNTITPIGWLSRVPTFKEKRKANPDYVHMGLFDYPVLMAADIILYKAEVVPVGDDQVPHIELTREIVRKFNSYFGETFPEPEAKLGDIPRILGLDGVNKMSKSLENCIYLDETKEQIWQKLSTAVTDTARKRRTDPGNPERCNVFTMHRAFSKDKDIEYCARECREAGIGCLDCKKILLENMYGVLQPLQEKQKELRNRKDYVYKILKEGQKKAKAIAERTMSEVYERIGIRTFH
ncbi:MAG TPA: tryptophan--tRNA ligase [candidate division WOR-3 bacterium]|uniref:Tryptophan--tRNA ligase n=1 Tax=candidate division WOR-3 bacterium TaxID=2052148 RepID=A0A9C9EKT1_UNCW3|nr:tryptophan--tRNA ligase [candidate division WOR-3 bacterium]